MNVTSERWRVLRSPISQYFLKLIIFLVSTLFYWDITERFMQFTMNKIIICWLCFALNIIIIVILLLLLLLLLFLFHSSIIVDLLSAEAVAWNQ